jgi:hypothetical protein
MRRYCGNLGKILAAPSFYLDIYRYRHIFEEKVHPKTYVMFYKECVKFDLMWLFLLQRE